MINNQWRKYIGKAGISQSEFARRAGIYAPMVTHFVSGEAAPITKELAERMCGVLGCRLTHIYEPAVIEMLYGERIEIIEPPKPRKRRPDTRVRLDPSVHAELKERAEKAGQELPIFVNRLLMKEAFSNEVSAGS